MPFTPASERVLLAFVLSVGLTALFGCDSDDAESKDGALRLTIYGEAFIEQGIPAAATSDGWAVNFERFEVTLEDVQLADVDMPDPTKPIDLVAPSEGAGHEVGVLEVPRGQHEGGSYVLAKIDIVGRAEKGEALKRFAWTFDTSSAYARCEATTLVGEDGPGVFQITVHADHLLYDSLIDDDPALGFQALADADRDSDGQITRDELAQTDIGRYDPGSEDIDDLWSWLLALVRTLGHVNGEGHCQAG